MRKSSFFIKSITLMVMVLAVQASFAVTLQGPSVATTGVGLDPCPSHANHVCWVRLHPFPARLMPAGGSSWFTPVYDAAAPDWTRQSGSLNGTFNIQTYNAFNDCPLGGAEFRMYYTPGAGDPATIKWTQGIFTNDRLGGRHGPIASYMDVKDPPGAGAWGPPYYPYQYADSHFYDKPSRYCPATGLTYWIGECYATTTPATKTMKIYEGVEWGFIYTCFGKTVVTEVRVGSTDAVVDYSADTGNLSFTAPVNVLTVTGQDGIDPEFSVDVLAGGQLVATGMQLAEQQDGMLLFTGGEMLVYDQDDVLVLSAEIEAVHVDDGLMARYGHNMIVLFGDIEELAHMPGFFATDFYFATLDMADTFAPSLTVATVEPFSQLILAGFDASSSATVLNSFQMIEPHHHFGDGNGDRFVDIQDYILFGECLTGPGTISGDLCFWADDDADRDVDVIDFAAFQRRFGTLPELVDAGACCLRDGSCEEVEAIECIEYMGGFYRGMGMTCSDIDPPCEPPMPGMIVINEVWADDPGQDTHEFVELFGPAGMPLDGFSLIVVDGDTNGSEQSVNFRKVTLQASLDGFMLDADGFFLMGTGPELMTLVDADLDLIFGNGNGVVDELQNGSQTYALVQTFMIEYCEGPGIPDPSCTGAPNQLTQASVDMIRFEGALDVVATRDTLIDHAYFFSPLVLDVEFLEFDGAMRVPNGQDSNSPFDWMVWEGVELGDPGDPSTPGGWN